MTLPTGRLSPLRKYGKAFVGLALVVLTSVQSFLGGGIDRVEVVEILIAATVAFGVWFVPVLPRYPATKTILGVTLAVLQALVVLILDGVNGDDIVQLVITGLAALGVVGAPAVSTITGAVAEPPGPDGNPLTN